MAVPTRALSAMNAVVNSCKPAENIHAVQLELSQITYMEESFPFRFNEKVAAQVRPTLCRLLEAMLEWAGGNAAK